MGRLDGRTALVTGGGGAIGAAICHRLAAEGARVAVTDADPAAASRVAGEIEGAGGRALSLALDITDGQRVRDVFEQVDRDLGALDILVNNAGWDSVAPFLDTDPSLWRRLIAVNFEGHLHCTHAALARMAARGAGKIVFVSSDAARVGSSGEAVYAGCKGALISFAKAIAREHARHRINVNVVCPGPTDTPLFWSVGQKLAAALQRAIPFGRLARPDEIAAAVAFFAGPDSDFITGQVLSVSGGLTMAG